MKRGLVLAIGFLFLAGAFVVLARPTAAQDITGQYGGDLNIAVQGFGGLDPTTASPADRKVLELVYDSLGRIDPVTLQITPWAATSWSWDGAKNITVTLRNDLTFSDGTPYDADDVAYSLNHYMKGGQERWNVFVVDSTTIRFDFILIDPATWDFKTSNRAGPGLFYTEGLTALLAWDAAGTRKYSGPYEVTAGPTASAVTLGPNEHHFAGRPFLDSITYMYPYRVDLQPNNATYANDAGCALMFRQVHLIGWPLITNDLSNLRDCVAGFGGWPNDPGTPQNESLRALLNPDPAQGLPHILAAKNKGTDFLYFGFAYNTGSIFVGAPGSEGQKLRSALYWFVNKGGYRDIEPNSQVTHGLQNQFNAPWAPLVCAPWTPCNTIVESTTVVAPAPVNRETDKAPGTLALNQAGIFDRDGDGIRQLSTGAPVSFRLLAPSFKLDPRKTTIANDMQFLFTSMGPTATVGLSVVVETYDTWAALDAAVAACTTSCMYVKRYTAATQLPDWVYSMPELLAANDPQVNLHLNLGAASSLTLAARTLHVGHVSHLAGAAADILPVLHFDALEAFDFETFDGWVNTFNGINNFWSLTGLHRPDLGLLVPTIDIFPTRSVGPGGTTTVQVTVRDTAGNPVGGVTVDLSVLRGTLTIGTTCVAQPTCTGTTLGSGIVSAAYNAPASVGATEDVWVSVIAWKGQYAGGEASNSLTLHPYPAGQLVIAVSRGSAAEIDSGASAAITVQVTDGTNAVSGASVRLSTDLPGASITPSTGTTDGSGIFRATFTATVKQGMTYRIFADVSAAGYEDESNRDSPAALSVRSNLGTVPVVQTTRNVPGFETAGAVGAIAVVFALVALARRRKEG